MTITIEAYTGSATIGATEWSLSSNSSGPGVVDVSGVYQAFIDCNAVSGSDVFRYRIYEKCRTGDTQRCAYSYDISGTQALAPILAAPSLVLGIGWDMTIQKIQGTDRAIAWRISKVA
jgi:hypothetical protein